MKKVNVLLAGVLLVFSLGASAVSDRCQDVINQSAGAFAAVDAVKDGYDETISENQMLWYFERERPLMVQIYDKGREAYSLGASRDEALAFIKGSNEKASRGENTLAARLQSEAATNAYMCGFDDAAQSL